MSDPFVVSLTQVNRHSLAAAGGKGANLGEMVRAGFSVPDGFVVTTAAYDAYCTAHDLEVTRLRAAAADGSVGALFLDHALPDGLREAVTAACAHLGEGPVAVRSSATAEDLPGASFAGQQETCLNVIGADAVLAAARRCWASLWSDRAVAYREGQAETGHLSMAVVVQRLIDADVAGVMFTANPVNGRRDETVISAAWGLGESVVSGETEPDEYVVTSRGVSAHIATKGVTTVTSPTGVKRVATRAEFRRRRTLTDAEAKDLAREGRRVADHFGAPQDIEWARDRDGFHLVQARPITALPDPVGPVPTSWPVPRPRSMYFRASIIEQLPDPLSPLFADLMATAVPTSLASLIDELTRAPGTPRIPVDIGFPTINGYAYYDYSYGTLAAWTALSPALLASLGRPGFIRTRWEERELPRFRQTVKDWADRTPAQMSAGELLEGTTALVQATCLYYTTVQSIIPVAATAELTWNGFYDRLLARPGDPPSSDFVVGSDSAPIRAEKALFALAVWCRDQQGLADALRDGAIPGADLPAGVPSEVWADFSDRFARYLDQHGAMVYNLDLINPVPSDDPTAILSALRHNLVETATDPQARQSGQLAHRDQITQRLLARLGPVRGGMVRRALRWTRAWGPVREDALADMGLGWPTARHFLRELGLRLVAAGTLAEPDQVFWLTASEARDAAAEADAGTTSRDLTGVIAERQMIQRGQAKATPPQSLPESASAAWLDRFMPSREQSTGSVLTGTSGTGGRVRATARVLNGPADFAAFQPGEVLVASITTPAYTPLFAQASGVVTDIGGVLSHGSIVAREYGIPAVLGVGSATKRIVTGDVITVDGPSATVHLTDDTSSVESAPKPRRRAARWVLTAIGLVAGAMVVRRLRARP